MSRQTKILNLVAQLQETATAPEILESELSQTVAIREIRKMKGGMNRINALMELVKESQENLTREELEQEGYAEEIS